MKLPAITNAMRQLTATAIAGITQAIQTITISTGLVSMITTVETIPGTTITTTVQTGITITIEATGLIIRPIATGR